MYKPINMTDPITLSMLESKTSLNLMETEDSEYEGSLFTEAVFSKGRDSLKPILEDVKVIKEELDNALADHEERRKTYNPRAYWKSTNFKKLEDDIKKIFGFRHVSIEPRMERYNSDTKTFESKQMNCLVYHQNRYPVDGLVTDKGFYDNSHSLVMELLIYPGLIQALTPEEIMAVFLHEFGHNVDPATMDIRYAKTNVLTKYLTDRKGDINKNERKAVSSKDGKLLFIPALLDSLEWDVQTLVSSVKSLFNKTKHMIKSAEVNSIFGDIFGGKAGKEKKAIESIKKAVRKDNENRAFNRQNYGEAFADNFARMYGYGPELASGLHKMDKNFADMVNSWSKKESMRQRYVTLLTQNAIKDVHKTGVHRVKALIKEYHDDINNPDTPKAVKKALEADVKELEKILDMYTNNFSDFQNKVNKAIAEELDKIDGSDSSDSKKEDDKKEIKESF